MLAPVFIRNRVFIDDTCYSGEQINIKIIFVPRINNKSNKGSAYITFTFERFE